jgi:hypothetical protein
MSNRPCRNIALHGYCKYEGKGCKFSHDVAEKPVVVPSSMTFTGQPSEKQTAHHPIIQQPTEEERTIRDFSHLQMADHNMGLSYYVPRSKLPELQYHLYMMPLSHHKKETHERDIRDFFISESLREELLKKLETMMFQPDPNGKLQRKGREGGQADS